MLVDVVLYGVGAWWLEQAQGGFRFGLRASLGHPKLETAGMRYAFLISRTCIQHVIKLKGFWEWMEAFLHSEYYGRKNAQ